MNTQQPHSNTSHRAKEVIESRNHPTTKRIRNLHQRAERERTRLFYVEGMRFVHQAIEQQAHIETLIYSSALLTHPFGQRLLRQQRRAGIPCVEVTPEVLQSVALNDDPQGIGAIVKQHWSTPEEVKARQGLCWLALETVQSPGNLGTIVRTCEAVGAAGLLLIGDAVDVYHPACVRASMAAIFSQRFVRLSKQQFIDWKQQHGCTLVGTSPSASALYDEVSYPSPLVLMMGGERKGLSAEQQHWCDVMVQIPMTGKADSLNLAVATGIMLYEVLRQQKPCDSKNLATAKSCHSKVLP